jgi:4-amino-4-deoxy-L-arabinose transferase-like glycosyltransferase
MNHVDTVEPPAGGRPFGIARLLREDLGMLIVIAATALLLRISFALIMDSRLPDAITREMNTINFHILKKGYDAMRPPLHTLFLRIVYSLFGARDHLAVFLVQGILSCTMVPCFYLTGRALFGRSAGILAAAIVAVYPNFIAYNLSLSPGSISLVVIVMVTAAAVIEAPETVGAVLSAVFISIGILLEPLLVYFLPGMVLTVKKKWVFIAVVLVILASWAIRNSAVQKRFVPVYEKRAYNISLRHFKNRYEMWMPVHMIYKNGTVLLGKSRVDAFSDDSERRLRNIGYISTYSHAIIMLLGLIGIIRYRRKEQLVVIAPVTGYILLLVLFSKFRVEYRIYLEPLLILYAAALIVRLDPRVRKKAETPRLSTAGDV